MVTGRYLPFLLKTSEPNPGGAHVRRLRSPRKVTFCKEENEPCGKSVLVLGPSPQFHPNNYSIWPDKRCVNRNYTEAAAALAMTTPAAPETAARASPRLPAVGMNS